MAMKVRVRLTNPYDKGDVGFQSRQGMLYRRRVHSLDKDFFEKKLTPFSCYLLDNYICTGSPTSVRVNAYPASIHLGTKTSVTLIPTPETFALHYFNFCPHADLPHRTEENQPPNQPYILTDYIGRLEDTTPGTTKK
ncbi:hypothetical protein M8C21_001921 [Ambrosia artemisiifolia]|uniref:Uncharacterized protein n=1 Tax=Ambrosia artemisiifolia TaxID=4212 RepID=A0AAD5GVM9_AMBAR|nr:hypothetical protein M8C21_001921 [Ambrosia artemisiifolia]